MKTNPNTAGIYLICSIFAIVLFTYAGECWLQKNSIENDVRQWGKELHLNNRQIKQITDSYTAFYESMDKAYYMSNDDQTLNAEFVNASQILNSKIEQALNARQKELWQNRISYQCETSKQ